MNFGEYMFSLLPGPLKRGKRALNQLCIFFQVLGRSFDQCKQVLLRVREEASVLTCSDAMLPVHGQDRDMLRLDGATLENYRIRLALKASIAEKAGTNEGIRYLARAFGYDQVEVIPGAKPDHWAEATVWFIGGDIVLDDRDLLLQELNKRKPARTLLHLSKEQRYQAALPFAAAKVTGRQMTISQE